MLGVQIVALFGTIAIGLQYIKYDSPWWQHAWFFVAVTLQVIGIFFSSAHLYAGPKPPVNDHTGDVA